MQQDDHFIDIYLNAADAYDRMILAEDADGNLLPALQAIAPLAHRRVVDLGSGTGRLPRLLQPVADDVLAIDIHLPMLQRQARERTRVGGAWYIAQGDNRHLPLADGCADVVMAGWSLGHFTGWFPDDWRAHIGAALREMHRIAKAGGALVIMETLTTGALTPAPPSPGLAAYYHWLEDEWGMARREIRTDFQFASVDEAVQQTEFFFGPELSAKIRTENWARLPEWTGIWSVTLR